MASFSAHFHKEQGPENGVQRSCIQIHPSFSEVCNLKFFFLCKHRIPLNKRSHFIADNLKPSSHVAGPARRGVVSRALSPTRWPGWLVNQVNKPPKRHAGLSEARPPSVPWPVRLWCSHAAPGTENGPAGTRYTGQSARPAHHTARKGRQATSWRKHSTVMSSEDDGSKRCTAQRRRAHCQGALRGSFQGTRRVWGPPLGDVCP